MKRNGFCFALLFLGAFSGFACEDASTKPPRNTTTSSSTSSSGSNAGGFGGQGGGGGEAGLGGQGGVAGGLPAPYCGDYVVDANEECDDGNQNAGDGCTSDCKIEPGEVEPNNSSSEASPYKNPFPAKIDPEGDVDYVSFSVTAPDTSVVARVIDIGDGACAALQINTVLQVLAADGTTVLAEDDDGGEGYCSRAVLPKLSVGNYFVRVIASPLSAAATFVYRLRVDQVVDVCGDGMQTLGEACDDGNTSAGDGCSPTCTIEITEVEPNDTLASATPYSSPYNAVLTPKTDVDVVAVVVPPNATSLTATTTDQGTNACAAKTLDTKVEILAGDGMTVLALGDDIVGNCGSALATGIVAGTYYVRITGGSLVTDPSPYGLSIVIQ